MPTEEQTYREGIKQDLAEIKTMVRFTNGKVRKIIIAMVLMGGILIGQAFTNSHDLIQFVAGIFL